MNDDMRHMDHIDDIAQSDAEVLRHKESTYRGSWKRAGGRSAWFMMRRNMDRLISMMARPKSPATFNIINVGDTIEAIARGQRIAGESALTAVRLPGTPQATVEIFNFLRDSFTAEDVFAKIEEFPSGADGTVLACIRDLRRYLLLIEAEMVSRGFVRPEDAPAHSRGQEYRRPDHDAYQIIADETGLSRDEVKRKVRHLFYGKKATRVENESVTTMPPWMSKETNVPGTPEDGGHHEISVTDLGDVGSTFCYPYVIDQHQFCTIRDRVGAELANAFYEQRAPGVHRLISVVENSQIPREIHRFYTRTLGQSREVWLLSVGRVPTHLREQFPRLQREMNAFEHNISDPDFQFMYDHDEGAGKYILKDAYADWGRES